MKYKNTIKMRLPEIQLLTVVPTQLKFMRVKDHEPAILLFETLFCIWECFNMGIQLPTKVMLGQTLVLMQMTFLNNVKESRHISFFPELLVYILRYKMRIFSGRKFRSPWYATCYFLINPVARVKS
jgi:hypothetical protein